ncbi:TetR/AcrR family transcriptional regulator [Geodermatophilus ruber]|uniref:Transcriptional regulator, TetR family n=1 Tax=Geodermatophilus ruber TaxID=504800 RepID=A0A1I3Z8T7_9ACTN|nr:TetR/AcrR family transcriptional regulator [Geodermatophilus ruber]SFK39979.1 transcriptional regulator, TetR family [Geodermatophilus ruber]
MARSDAAENVSRLLRAARDAVAADGPGVGVRVIAERAEVGVSTLYRHFPDKGSLIDAVSVHRWATMDGLARRPLAREGSLSRIVLLLDTFSRMVSADHGFIESTGIRVGRLPAAAIRGPKTAFDEALAGLWVRAQQEGQVHRYADPRDLIELTGAIRERTRRPAQLRLLVQGVCVQPEAGTALLTDSLRAPDPGYL